MLQKLRNRIFGDENVNNNNNSSSSDSQKDRASPQSNKSNKSQKGSESFPHEQNGPLSEEQKKL